MKDRVGAKPVNTGMPVDGPPPVPTVKPTGDKAVPVDKAYTSDTASTPSKDLTNAPFAVSGVGNLPAPGTPEAAVYKHMQEQPGIPPQTAAAFRQLPPEEQRAMGEMFGRMSEQQQWSFCVHDPAEQRALAKAFSQMSEPNKAAFLKLTPGDQIAITRATAAMNPAQQQAMAKHPVAEQKQIAVAHAGLSPTGKAAFAKLTPDQQAEVGRVWAEAGRIDLHGVKAPKAQSPDDIRARLDSLLTSGKLTQVGTDGKTTLDHLDRLRTLPLALPPGTPASAYRQDLFNQLVTELDDPRTIQQGFNETCGATCAQREFARYRPSDYASFVTGLVSAEGKARLPNGEVVTRPPDTLVAHERTVKDTKGNDKRVQDDRTAVDRIVQSSLMNYASPVTYRNSTDSNSVAGIGLGGGLPGSSMAKLYNALRPAQGTVLASDSVATTLDGGNMTGVTKKSLTGGIARQLQSHPGKTVPTEVHWKKDPGTFSGGLHWIEVSRVSEKRVYFQNPHGNSFPPDQLSNKMLPRDEYTDMRYIEKDGSDGGPPRRIYEDGSESVSRAWFDASVEEAVVDPNVAGEVQGRKENQLDFSGIM
jgi:hypothetical protein